jgi:hypothetical protein
LKISKPKYSTSKSFNINDWLSAESGAAASMELHPASVESGYQKYRVEVRTATDLVGL